MDNAKTVRRIVTGHDADGKAIAIIDGPVAARQRSPGGNAVTMLWVTAETPVDVSGSADRAETKVGVPPPPNGSIFRIVEFPPAVADAPQRDHHAVLTGMGIDPATQGYMRDPRTHRTPSVDYAIVLDGEIDMLMDDTQVHMQRSERAHV